MKTCKKCKKSLPESMFSKDKRRKDGLFNHCKPCAKEYNKQHYNKNRQYYLDKARKREAEFHDWLRGIKAEAGCSRCPENDPVCLDFHHRDPSQKSFALNKCTAKSKSKELVEQEIAKCDIVCANCHRKLHAEHSY